MAGGKGKRLLPLTKNCPKPMLPLNDKPILEHIIENFRSQGFRNFVISVNHLKNQIEEYFGDGTALGCSIDYVRESKPLGTAGSISLIDKNKVEFPIIISNGDLLTKMSFGDLLNFHLDQKSDATMATRKYEIQIPFGVVSTLKTTGYLVWLKNQFQAWMLMLAYM